MKRCVLVLIALVALRPTNSLAQHHYSDWIYRSAADTTIVRCWNDSLSTVSYPPGCMGMGMMYPDSLFCQFRSLPLDSLHHPFDSTFLCWRRLQLGSDSLNFSYMHCDTGYGNQNTMMGFMKEIQCRVYWDSLLVDSLHMGWSPTSARCWDGTRWVTPASVSVSGSTVLITSSELYSAIAIVGAPGQVSAVSGGGALPAGFRLDQNYPNPFNPSTVIGYTLPRSSHVSLTVYNLLGNRVATLINGNEAAGIHNVTFVAQDLPTGVYFYRLETPSFTDVKRMVVVR